MARLDTTSRPSAASTGMESFLFLYFSQLAGAPVRHASTRKILGTVADFVVQATVPYPTVTGVSVRIAGNTRLFPWSAVINLNARELELDPAQDKPAPAFDYSVRRDLLRQLAVEVSDTSVVRIWDLHFVYSENKMVLAHAETGIRGLLRAFHLEKAVLFLLGDLMKTTLRERFATFRHLHVLRTLPDGTIPIPRRILDMHPADLSAVLRQLPSRLRRHVFTSLTDDAAAAVLIESVPKLQRCLLADCPALRRATLERLMIAGSSNLPPL